MTRRLAAFAVALVTLAPSPAAADWLLTPFIGTAFAGETTLGDLERGAGQTKAAYGVAFTVVGDGVLGIEGVIAHTPGFFRGDGRNAVVLDSRVTTYMGNALFTLPLGVTRESLRPYAAVGAGLIQARTTDVLGFFSIDRNLPGLVVGGGAIGFITPDAGLRFDVRYIRALGEEEGLFARAGVARLSFWRAGVGVTIRLRS